MFYAFPMCIHCKRRYPCIMVYASSRSCMGSLILMLHYHCKHTSQTVHHVHDWSILSLSLDCISINRHVCNQHYQSYSDNELWAKNVSNITYQSLVLSSLAIHEFCDECHRHLSSSCGDLSSIRTWSPFSLLSCHTHPCTIYPCSRYTHLVILQRLLPSTSTFSGVIAFCHF
jgi:hypothetical protein